MRNWRLLGTEAETIRVDIKSGTECMRCGNRPGERWLGDVAVGEKAARNTVVSVCARGDVIK